MTAIEDLKKIHVLQNMSESFLEQLIPHIETHNFNERDVIYEEGQKADRFFMLKRGKVLLEVEVSGLVIISLGSVKTGYLFGWSALIPDATYTTYAICSEPCEVLWISGREFLDILNRENNQAYIFMYNAFKILKGKLKRRTDQFLKVMSKHPDIQKLLGL
ncbi:MAG TPA: cyclic nucleotide-binding domain-containing protein [Desulfobacteraceae bacterium]|nr:cyclic nucleotide-binding domain-containing protein [Desulfobacteraceae bacterium]